VRGNLNSDKQFVAIQAAEKRSLVTVLHRMRHARR
jgi:hypothetical protein